MNKYLLCLSLCLVFAISGCGGQGFVPAGGKVTFEDGSPLSKGGIAFSTDTFMADASIKPDGTYTLSSLKPGDGLPPGTYKVTIGASEVNDKEQTTYLVDPLFADTATTPLTAEVTKGGKNQFDFTVTKPKK